VILEKVQTSYRYKKEKTAPRKERLSVVFGSKKYHEWHKGISSR